MPWRRRLDPISSDGLASPPSPRSQARRWLTGSCQRSEGARYLSSRTRCVPPTHPETWYCGNSTAKNAKSGPRRHRLEPDRCGILQKLKDPPHRNNCRDTDKKSVTERFACSLPAAGADHRPLRCLSARCVILKARI